MQSTKNISPLRTLYHSIGLLRNPISETAKMTRLYGDFFSFGNINFFSKQTAKPAFFVHNPLYLKHILKDNQANYSRGLVFKKRKDLSALDTFLGNGIFLSDGADWEAQHKMLKQLFGNEGLSKVHSEISEQTRALISSWRKRITNTSVIDIETDIHYLMLDILFKTYFVTDETYPVQEVFDTFQKIMKSASFKESTKEFFYIGARWLLGIKQKENEALKQIAALDGMMQQLFDHLQANPGKAGLLSQLLLEKFNQGDISYQDIRDTWMNFIFAGFETTAAAISWSLYCFAKYPHHQEAVRTELRKQNSTGSTPWKDIDLPLLNNFTKESMRFYPPVWFYIRESIADDTIDGQFIPKGSFIFICPFALHQQEIFWENPTHFDPNRFIKQNMQGKSYQYIPFGQGKRMCLGQALAGIQMHIILASLIDAFAFENPYKKDPSINPAIIIKGATPLHLKVISVHPNS